MALAIAVAAGASDESRWWSLPLAVLGAVFLAAVWVSLRTFESRTSVLKTILVVVMIVAIVGTPIYGIELPLLLAPAVALLAHGAGLIFQAKR
jgi:hypothetical protein